MVSFRETKKQVFYILYNIYKSTELEQFKPISVLTAISKKLLFYNLPTSLMKIRRILPKLQCGSCKNRSKNSVLLKLFSDLFYARYSHLCSTIVILDHFQAFDSIYHKFVYSCKKSNTTALTIIQLNGQSHT